MADPFALLARANAAKASLVEAGAVAMAGMRLHPQSREIARELTLCLVELGRDEEALPVSQVAINGFPDDVELLMAYGRLWEPIDPDIAQWAFSHAKENQPEPGRGKVRLRLSGSSPQGVPGVPRTPSKCSRLLPRPTGGCSSA